MQVLFIAALVLAARSRRELIVMAAAFLAGQCASVAILPSTGWQPAARFVEAAGRWRASLSLLKTSVSYAGLTRVSITLHNTLSKRMDRRIKSGDDGGAGHCRLCRS